MLSGKTTIAKIASFAGVGTATVDRVLNDRPHVRDEMRQRVMQAKLAIESNGEQATFKKPHRIRVLLPEGAGPATEFLSTALQDYGRFENVFVECVFTKKLDPAVLARKLRACARQGIDAVAFQALDEPRVHDAVDELAEFRIPCLALMSNFESDSLIGFVGLDNRSAGRTAGLLMGRSLHQNAKVAILSGGGLYRVHEEREMGFRALIRSESPNIEIVGTLNGGDDIRGNHEAVIKLIKEQPDLAGIYNVGGGNEGVIRAFSDLDAKGEIVFIGHNLTRKTKAYLLEGSMDFVIHLNIRNAAEQAVRHLIAYLDDRPFKPVRLPAEIITRENLNGVSIS